MKTVKTHVWELEQIDPVTNECTYIFYTMFENGYGFDLLICLSCGTVYGADVVHELYVPIEREKFLKEALCYKCGKCLAETVESYPEFYIDKNGVVRHWERPNYYPDDKQSVIREIISLYD